MRIKSVYLSLVATTIICLSLSMSLWAQTSSSHAKRDPVARLTNALQSAGTSALTSDQQQQLQSLIAGYKAAHPAGAPDPVLQSARNDLQTAILAKNSAGVADPAGKIASEMANNTTSRLEGLANFSIQALGILSSDQITALQTRLGSARLVRLLESLAGGGFGRARNFRMRASG